MSSDRDLGGGHVERASAGRASLALESTDNLYLGRCRGALFARRDGTWAPTPRGYSIVRGRCRYETDCPKSWLTDEVGQRRRDVSRVVARRP